MLPSMYGCSAQQTSEPPPPTPTLTISSITITTVEYGTDESNLQTIDPSQQITTVLNSGNSFTVPEGGLAQYYTGSDPAKQVFHAMLIQYTTNDFTINDLSGDEVQAVYETTLNETPANSGLNTWLTQAEPSFNQGFFLPSGGGAGQGIIAKTMNNIDGTPFTRNDFFQTSPVVGVTTIPLEEMPNGFFKKTSKGTEPIEVDRLNRIKFAAKNLGSSSSIDIKLKILLKSGLYAEGTQTITIPSNAVKENIVTAETFTLQEITITPKLSTPATSIFPQQALPVGTTNPVILNTANNFTMGEESTYYQDNRYESGGDFYIVGNSFDVVFDTSTLTPSNFPEFEVQAEIVISGTLATPDELGWFQDGGVPVQTFAWEAEERSQIITGGLVSPEIAYPDYTDSPLRFEDNQNNTTFNVKVRIQQTNGLFAESNEITVVIGEGAILPFVPT